MAIALWPLSKLVTTLLTRLTDISGVITHYIEDIEFFFVKMPRMQRWYFALLLLGALSKITVLYVVIVTPSAVLAISLSRSDKTAKAMKIHTVSSIRNIHIFFEKGARVEKISETKITGLTNFIGSISNMKGRRGCSINYRRTKWMVYFNDACHWNIM